MRSMMQLVGRLSRHLAGLVALLVLCHSVARAQGNPTEREIAKKADTYMTTLASLGRFSGSVLISRGGVVLLRKGYGLANIELGVSNNAETRFRLASISKQFTAVAILMLQETGNLRVSDPVCDYVSRCPEAWRSVSVHHLLSHTSGLPDVTDLPDFSTFKRLPTTPERTIDRIRDLPLDFPPGSAYKYSNSGYIVLGTVIERASGKKYEEFVKAQVFDRLGMRNTGVDFNATVVAKRAAGYERRGGTVVNADLIDMSLPYAAGWFYTTVGDMKLWDDALYEENLLPASALRAMFAPVSSGHGKAPASMPPPSRGGPPGAMPPPPGAPEHAYAWNIPVGGARRSMYMNGLIDGFTSWYVRYPEQRASVIILSNLEGADLRTAANDLTAILFGESYELPSNARPVEIDARVADTYLGRYEVPANIVFKNPALGSLKRPGEPMILEIAKDGAALVLRPNASSGRGGSFGIEDRLIPESDGSFRAAGLRVRIRFTRDANGKVVRLELHDGAQTVSAWRVGPS